MNNQEQPAEVQVRKPHSPLAWAGLILSCALVLGLSIYLVTLLAGGKSGDAGTAESAQLSASAGAHTEAPASQRPAAPDTGVETDAPRLDETETAAAESTAQPAPAETDSTGGTEAESSSDPAPAETDAPAPESSVQAEPAETAAGPDAPEAGTVPTPTPEDVVGPADVTTPAVKAGTIYVTEGCGYAAYYFNEGPSQRYCDAVSSVARALEGEATVYSIICPLSTGIMLSDEVRQGTGFSDEKAAIRWMCDHMDPLVKNVPLYGALKSRNDQYIFFHTDHHWTALGAYYAYREFCAQKGIVPHELDSFETYVFEGFMGSLYNYSNKHASLNNNPDTVTAYIPKGTNSMHSWMRDGSSFTEYQSWPIVKDVSNYSRGNFYLTFVAGDQPYNYAHNESIHDGSSVLIVKDSYGNAFIPFLIDHYEHIYWIDYRSYMDWAAWAGKPDGNVSTLVREKGIQDVILCNNISSTGSGTLLDTMGKMFR